MTENIDSQKPNLFTSRINYSGADRLDITRKTGKTGEGLIFAPSWKILSPRLFARRDGPPLTEESWFQYVDDFTAEMRESYRADKEKWNNYAKSNLTLVCYCTDKIKCHRYVVADILTKLGAVYGGER